MMLIELYISFFKVGLFGFGGGYASLPLIQEEVVNAHNWISLSEFNNLITISQMTPGPIAINSATFVGSKILGIPGSIVATLGCITPSVFIVGTISYLYVKYKDIEIISNILKILRPAVVSMILAAGISIFKTALFDVNEVAIGNMDVEILILSIVTFFAIRKSKMDPIVLMIASGFIYLVICLIRG